MPKDNQGRILCQRTGEDGQLKYHWFNPTYIANGHLHKKNGWAIVPEPEKPAEIAKPQVKTPPKVAEPTSEIQELIKGTDLPAAGEAKTVIPAPAKPKVKAKGKPGPKPKVKKADPVTA